MRRRCLREIRIIDDESPHAIAGRFGLCRRFHLGIEIGDDVFERRNGLLDGGDLDQLPARDRAIAVLQSDHQIPPLLLELNERQTMVWQVSQHDFPTPLMSSFSHTAPPLPFAYRISANFSDSALKSRREFPSRECVAQDLFLTTAPTEFGQRWCEPYPEAETPS
jgi:hypothetical protein